MRFAVVVSIKYLNQILQGLMAISPVEEDGKIEEPLLVGIKPQPTKGGFRTLPFILGKLVNIICTDRDLSILMNIV